MIDPLHRYTEKDGIYGDWNIFFAYNNFRFYWVWDNYIYLVDDDNHWIKIKGRPNSDEGENHYRLDMNRCSDISPQGFLSNLSELAHGCCARKVENVSIVYQASMSLHFLY